MKPARVFSTAVAIVPLSILAGGLLSIVTILVIQGDLTTFAPNSAAGIAKDGITVWTALSALVLAPVVENIFCAIWSALFSRWRTSHWAVKPAVIAAIAGVFHVLAYSSPLSASVIPGFFIMASLIENVKNRTVGFWSSVLHHVLLNAYVLGVAYFLQ